MQIHTVQPNETIYTIARTYNVPVERIMRDNNLPPNYNLNIGQSLIITFPEKTYIVQKGDTIPGVVQAHGISELQLIRNNPYLVDRNFLYAGEELVISYQQKQSIQVNGYAFSHIDPKLLRKSLPFLTYLTIINYKVSADGNITGVNDCELINLAKEYKVAPVMMISSITEQGKGSYAINQTILNSPEVQETIIENVLSILRLKGFYGLNMGFQSILPADLPNYVNFITNMTSRLNNEGFQVFVTLIPSTYGYISGISANIPYFASIGEATNNVILMSYQWSTAFMPSVAQTTVSFLQDYLEYVMTQIPPEKIFLGLTRIAYDWEIPYIEGETVGSAMTNIDALNLANQTVATIYYDDTTQTPYYYYNTSGVEHFVWFKDARTINAIIDLVVENGLKGVSIWNVMYFDSQTWLVFNTQYHIESVL